MHDDYSVRYEKQHVLVNDSWEVIRITTDDGETTEEVIAAVNTETMADKIILWLQSAEALPQTTQDWREEMIPIDKCDWCEERDAKIRLTAVNRQGELLDYTDLCPECFKRVPVDSVLKIGKVEDLK